MEQPAPKAEYKPNIYPIMYWAIVYGIIAAFALFVLHVLSGFIAIVWFPVFLAGVVWGGYRKYKQDKAAWMQSTGTTSSSKPKSPVEEFKDAARDIAQASREMIVRQAQEDVAAEQASVSAGEIPTAEGPEEIDEAPTEEVPRPPASPLQPLV
jgi:uncharacterized membrane protein